MLTMPKYPDFKTFSSICKEVVRIKLEVAKKLATLKLISLEIKICYTEIISLLQCTQEIKSSIAIMEDALGI